jgi:twitching motility two-component system response regulator PilH
MKNILVVEDEPGYQELMETVLGPKYSITICGNAEDAIAKLDGSRWDLILCDINMLGLTGFEVLSRVKHAGLAETSPVVMCSAQTDATTRESAIRMGAAGFLAKPFAIDNLIKIVESLLPETPSQKMG